MSLSKTQLATLKAMAETGEKVYYMKWGRSFSGLSGCAPKGATIRTMEALERAGLVKINHTRSGYDSVPAGPFGRTSRWGYKSVYFSEITWIITDKGKAHVA